MKWLEVATKGGVVLHHKVGIGAQSMTVFKCMRCHDNWNVGDHLLAGTSVPSELQDWVKLHRHVCKKFTGNGSYCFACQWPYGAHEESWNKDLIGINEGQFNPEYQKQLEQKNAENQEKAKQQALLNLQQYQQIKEQKEKTNIAMSEAQKAWWEKYQGYPSYAIKPQPVTPVMSVPKIDPPLPEPKGRRFR